MLEIKKECEEKTISGYFVPHRLSFKFSFFLYEFRIPDHTPGPFPGHIPPSRRPLHDGVICKITELKILSLHLLSQDKMHEVSNFVYVAVCMKRERERKREKMR